jgi:hypothetical protein
MALEEQIFNIVKEIKKIVDDNNAQIKVQNGRIGRVEKDISHIKTRIRKIEEDDFIEVGKKIGWIQMKASTKTILMLLTACAGLYFAVLTHFKISESNLIKHMDIVMSDRIIATEAEMIKAESNKEAVRLFKELKAEIRLMRKTNGKKTYEH